MYHLINGVTVTVCTIILYYVELCAFCLECYKNQTIVITSILADENNQLISQIRLVVVWLWLAMAGKKSGARHEKKKIKNNIYK